MSRPNDDPLVSRLEAWGKAEIQEATARWTPEFLEMKAWIVRRERSQIRVARIERLGWFLATTAGTLGLWAAWPTQSWISALDFPVLFFPVLFSLGLLGRGIWVLGADG
jgi:hypothetical protein